MTAEVCPYCRCPLTVEDQVVACEGCGTAHHKDCYTENGGCTIFGCKCAPADEPKLSVSTPELVAVAAAGPAASSASPVRTAVPPPPPPGGSSAAAPAPPSVDELRQIANRVVPSMFGSFIDEATGNAQTSVSPPDPIPPGEPKSRTTFIVLGALLGALGAHNFYAGYRKKGLAQLAITVFTLGFGSPMSWIWAIIDICTVSQDSKGVQFEL